MLKHLFSNPEWKSKFKFCVSYTTRKPRDGEVEGVDYFFIDEEEFERIKKEEKFAEYREIYGNMYGTPMNYLMDIVNEGYIPVLHFGLTGVKSFLENFPDANTVHITLSSLEEVRKRLEERGSEDGEMLEKRVRSFEKCQEETRGNNKLAKRRIINADLSQSQ